MTLPDIYHFIAGVLTYLFKFWTKCFWIGHNYQEEINPYFHTCSHCKSSYDSLPRPY